MLKRNKEYFAYRFLLIGLCAFQFQVSAIARTKPSPLMDELVFGNPVSEKSHLFKDVLSKDVKGALNEPARILLPPTTESWQGGSMSFVLKIDPQKQNYVTVRLWGSDVSHDRLYIICNGKQIGYRHLGDVDMLDVGSDAPFYNERFFYNTSPLPLTITKGKKEVSIEIRSQGEIWGYGQTWDKYQHNMTEPTRGLYKIYSHTDGAFVPPFDEKQGAVPRSTVRTSPGIEVLQKLKDRVNETIKSLVEGVKPLNQMQMQLLAKAYTVKWSSGYHDKKLLAKVLNGLDNIYAAYKINPKLAQEEPSTWNPDWFGLGPSGQVLHLLFDELKPNLDATIEDGQGGKITRKDAFTDMLVACRDWHERNRRQYSNQSMINDLYGIYYANKGLQKINPTKAQKENEVLRYLYESLGMQPWLGSETDNGPNHSQGDNYWQLTPKGLTKELGFVGNYGEVLDWVTEIYEATRPQPDQQGDSRIKEQAEKIALARAPFRYPMLDNDGFTAMRQETVVGWRDTHYPGDVTYAQRPSWDGSPFQIVAATLSPKLVGYAQQMLNDNQFFTVVENNMKNQGFRTTAGLLQVPDQYEIIKLQPASNNRLPMGWDQPDFIFSDEEDGVVAIKNGKEILYASLYWRARNAINNLARVHALTPNYDRISTVCVDEVFDSSGLFYTRPDWTNMAFGNGGLKYPDGIHSAYAGEQLPIAKIPAGVPFKVGQENPYAGRAQFYQLKYGNYLIAMNSTNDKTFDLKVPDEFKGATDLSTKQKIDSKILHVKPQATLVLFID